MPINITLRPSYDTILFTDVWEDYNAFNTDYTAIMAQLSTTAPITTASAKTIYYLLYARYGNNPIANFDETQWKYKIISIIFMYGGKWERQLQIQKTLNGLSEAEIMTGSKQIYNHAFNPSSAPTTDTLDELQYINDQNTAKNQKSKLEAYSLLWNMLHANATEDFLNKFKSCFKAFVSPERTLIYATDDEEGV